MKLLIKVFVIWLFFMSMLCSSEVSWTGKWQVHWSDGTFILALDQHGSDVNGTFDMDYGTLTGKAHGNTLKASTVTGHGITNELALTMSENKKSFFGNTLYGDWVTGIRVDNEIESNGVGVDQTTPLNAFYSFLALGNAVRAGSYDLHRVAMNIIYFSEDQNRLRYSSKLLLVNKLFDIISETFVNKLDFFKKDVKVSNTILLNQLGTDVRVPLEFIQDTVSKKWMIKLPDDSFLEQKLKELLTARGKYEVDTHSNLSLSTQEIQSVLFMNNTTVGKRAVKSM